MSDWRPIKIAPAHRRVLVWDGGRHVNIALYDTAERTWWTRPKRGPGFVPRYWAPIPELVKPGAHDHE